MTDANADPPVGAEAARPPPSALVITTLRWLSTARLGLALSEAGFVVNAVCPAGHPLRKADFLGSAWRNSVISPLAVLRDAVVSTKPDLVVPCDDRALAQLLALHAAETGADAISIAVRAAIERSLAAPEHFAILQARRAIADLAASVGASVAETLAVEDREDLERCAATLGFPMVVKADGSWGGLGIRVVGDMDEAARAFHRLRRAPTLAWAIWRMIKDRDAGYLASALRGERAAVSAQRFVRGVPANVAAACWRGRVLSAVTVEALRTAGDRGPATVVRRVESPEMSAAVTRLAEGLGLSGLCGFDFMRDEVDGRYYLIEINPRATPTCHLMGAEGVDLLAALRAALANEAPAAGERAAANEIIALYPQEVLRDPASHFLTVGRHDVPRGAGFLVDAGQAAIVRRRRMDVLARYVRAPAWASGRAPDPAKPLLDGVAE